MANKKGQQNRKNASVQSQNSLDPNSNQSLQEQLEHYKDVKRSWKASGKCSLKQATLQRATLLPNT